MSFYFNYVIERKNYDGEWVCTNFSSDDDELNSVKTYKLKNLFINTEYYENINFIEDSLTDKSFEMFSEKIDKNSFNEKNSDYPYKYKYKMNSINNFSIDYLDSLEKTKLKNNDICLWFDIKNLILFGKDIFTYVIPKNKTMIMSLKNIIDEIKDEKSLIEKISEWENVIYDDKHNKIGIIFNNDVYSLREIIKYSPIFKIKKCPLDKLITGISVLRYFNKNKEIKQYNINAKVSFPKDIEYIINDCNKIIKQFELSHYIEIKSKDYIKSILNDLRLDKSEMKSLAYIKLNKFCEEQDDTYDVEYIDELKSQKQELEILYKLVGENGRLIWNIV